MSYAEVNGLRMYYEVHGTGQPLVVLHGAFMTVDLMGDLIPGLAKTRQVVAVEMQGHGHTADVDRPFTYEGLADDAAALIRHLGIAPADVYGYSLGGGAAIQLAIRHPELVRKLVAVGASYTSAGMYPEVWSTIEDLKAENFDGTTWRAAYDRVAPDPSAFPALVEKMKRLDATPYDWTAEAIRDIAAPTLIVVGDADGTTPEHAVDMFRLRGGGVYGDVAELPRSQLAILPGTSHVGILERADLLVPIVSRFLDAPVSGT